MAAAGRQILQWAKDRGLGLRWGKGKQYGTFYPVFDHAGREHRMIGVYTDGRVEIQFVSMRERPPFNDDAKRRELLERLNRIGRVTIPDHRLDTWPSFPLAALTDTADMQHFLNTFDWYVQEVRAS